MELLSDSLTFFQEAQPAQLGLKLVGLLDRLAASHDLERIDTQKIGLGDRKPHQGSDIRIIRPMQKQVQADNAPTIEIVGGPIEQYGLHRT